MLAATFDMSLLHVNPHARKLFTITSVGTDAHALPIHLNTRSIGGVLSKPFFVFKRL